MRLRLRGLLESRIIRYLITGGTGFVAELVVILVLFRGLGVSSVIAVGTSFWVGIIVSFFLQKLFTFRNAQRTPRALTLQGALYAALVLVNYVFTLGFVALMEPVWGAPEVARAIALIITTAWNYLVYRYIIFR